MFLLKPVITEKSTADKGSYTFVVNSWANKIEIKQAFEKLYGVKVAKVNILKVKEKIRLIRNKKRYTKREAHKKAIIMTAGKKQIDINKMKG